jgi:hypothetical protein
MQDAGEHEKGRCRTRAWSSEPDRKRCHEGRDGGLVERAEGRGWGAAATLPQPVGREVRHDPAADEGDQHEQERDARTARRRAVEGSRRGHVRPGRRRREGQEDAEHGKVPPIAGGDQLPGTQGDERPEQPGVQDERRQPADAAAGEVGETRADPGCEQQHEQPSRHHGAPGPVRHGGEQESRHDGAAIAEHHLVLVPGQRIERARTGRDPGQHGEPVDKTDDGPGRSTQEERPEAVLEERCGWPGGPGRGRSIPGGRELRVHADLPFRPGQASNRHRIAS